MATSTMIGFFTTGLSNISSVLAGTLGTAIALIMGLAGLFFVVKWTTGKIQGRRK